MDKEQEKAAQARESALKGALTQIERSFGQGSIMRMGDEAAQVKVAAIPTGALSLDLALGVGGLPRGRIVEVFGITLLEFQWCDCHTPCVGSWPSHRLEREGTQRWSETRRWTWR